MIHRARMFKTLACLIVAMTGTSALLGWMDPLPPSRVETPSFDVILRDARSVVTEPGAIHRSQWRRIEVVAGPAFAASTPFLTATAQRANHHFHVDLEGRPSGTTSWIRQEPLSGDPHRVTIEVARRGIDRPMSRTQWLCVQALVAALSDTLGLDDTSLPVHLHSEWAQVYTLEPGAALNLTPRKTSSD